MLRIAFDDMIGVFSAVLQSRGMSEEDAKLCASLVATASLEGVYTHGANRFPVMIKNIDEGRVDVHARCEKTGGFGALERWDGKSGVGPLNAYACMNRTIHLAKEHGIGCVALSNTTHWMRPGTYGLMAAEADCIGILWTNTIPLMPAWGSKETKVGNNPLVLAVPAKDGPILVDTAMSLFSYGKLETYIREDRPLPIEGGFDEEGKLTRDANAIMKSMRPLPIGFWKGTSLAFALDLIAASLSGGRTTRSVATLGYEHEVSQVFIAINLSAFDDRARIEEEIAQSIADLKASIPLDPAVPVRFPGEHRLKTIKENKELGIPVDDRVWEHINSL